MKPIIINILYHEPDYDYLKDEPRPAVNWDTADGNWVGIYRNEIPNKLAREVLQYTDEFEYEVWQPDYRADKVYSHRFEDGMVHRLFPAYDLVRPHGIKLRKHIYSPQLSKFLKEYGANRKLIVNLNGDLGSTQLRLLKELGHFPILQSFRGTLHLPQTLIFKQRKNVFASFTYLHHYLKAKKLVKHIDHITHQNDLFMQELSQMYTGPTTKLTSGCDFSFWKKLDRKNCKLDLKLPFHKPVFFSSSLLIPRKQIDKLIKVCIELDKQHDFLLIISGHGTAAYEQYLHQLAAPLIEKGKVKFVGYVRGESLRRYYNAADLYINSSASEGGPVSAMKAIACETPVFSTNVGNVAEYMRMNRSGVLVGETDYKQWQVELEKIIMGKQVTPFDRQEAASYYDWQNIAARWVAIYRKLNQCYYQPDAAAVLA